MSGDPEQEYFANGIVEDIITALWRFKEELFVSRAVPASPARRGRPMSA
jgi:TolB-like protein